LPARDPAHPETEVLAELREIGDDCVGGNAPGAAWNAEVQGSAVLNAVRGTRHVEPLAVGGNARNVQVVAVLLRPHLIGGLNEFEVPVYDIGGGERTHGAVSCDSAGQNPAIGELDLVEVVNRRRRLRGYG